MPKYSKQAVKVNDNSYVGSITQIARFGLPTILVIAIVAIAIVEVSGYDLRTIIETSHNTETQISSGSSVEATPEEIPTDIRGPIISDPLDSSPYRNAYINLISALPETKVPLQAGYSFPYTFTVSYYIPQFDWKSLGYEPQIRIDNILGDTEYGSRQVTPIKQVIAEVGKESINTLTGRFIAPNDRDIWKLEINIDFVDRTSKLNSGTTGANQTISLEYSIVGVLPEKKNSDPVIIDPIASSPYKDAYINLVSATPNLKLRLQGKDDLPYIYTVRYYVPQYDWENLGYEPHIQVHKILGYTEQYSRQTSTIKDIIAKVGQENIVNLNGRFIVPNDRDIWELEINLVFVETSTTKGRTGPTNQKIPLEYSIIKSP